MTVQMAAMEPMEQGLDSLNKTQSRLAESAASARPTETAEQAAAGVAKEAALSRPRRRDVFLRSEIGGRQQATGNWQFTICIYTYMY